MQPTPDNSENENTARRRLIGFFMFPIALFPFLALISYNWRDMPDLCIPPMRPTANLIGVVGDWFAYTGYQLIGLAIWAIPLLCVFIGLLLVIGKTFHPGRRTCGLLLFLVSATCLLQIAGSSSLLRPILHDLNIEPNAGGAIGYLIMTCGLSRLLSPFGSSVLMISLMVFALLTTIGLQSIISGLARLTAWASDRNASSESEDEREDKITAARAARDAALAERLAEKERIAEEKARAKAEKEAERQRIAEEKARIKAEKEAEREAARAAKEAERAAKEAERAALAAAKEAERQAAIKERDDLFARLKASANEGPVDFFPARETPAARPPAPVQPPPPPAPATRQFTPPPPPPVVRPAAPAPQPVAVQQPAPAVAEVEEDKGPYLLPSTDLLNPPPPKDGGPGENVDAMAQRLIDTLKVFDVNAQLAYYVAGPVVTQYALSLDLGTRVEKVAGLSRNLQMALQATSLRIEAPIPGKNAVGIEVPNQKPASVHFSEIIAGELWQKNSPGKFQVPLLLGKDAAGNDLIADLAKLPHLLVAGATGQGKSVCLNSIINGLLMCRTPEQLKFIMVDPKRVEFTAYNKLPHLLVPVINDTKKVVFGLRWAVVEMERRLKMFARAGCRNIVDFNNRKQVSQPDMFGGEEQLGEKDIPRTIPYIVIVIDEVADIMQAAQKEVEPVIARLTALARATGIHLILATQRPDTKVITGTIKSNIPGRIAFKTSSAIDSRTILDAQGSEQLIGKGDMLFKMSDGRLLRAQGSFISDDEINRVIKFIGEHSNTEFDEKLTARLDKIKEADPADSLEDETSGEDEQPAAPADPLASTVVGGVPPPAGMTASKEDQMYMQALVVLRDTKRASTSHLQRRMGIGYNHAARLMDLLQERGVISEPKGTGAREILLDPEVLLNGGAQPTPASEAPVPEDAVAAPSDPTAIPTPENEI